VSAQAKAPRVGFTSELGLAVSGGPDELVGEARVLPELCIPPTPDAADATVRPSVLLTWADILIGSLANEHTLPRICMTVDLSVRAVAPIRAGDTLRARGRLLKAGRTLTFGETVFAVDGADEPAAVALGTFVASPRPQDVGVSVMRGEQAMTHRETSTPSAPVSELLRSRVLAPGVVEVPRHDRVLNWADTIQGGAIAACAEEAVLALDGDRRPAELEIRYLGAVREGPMRATATPLGDWVRIEVVDTGNDDRPVAIAAANADRTRRDRDKER